MEGHQFVFVGGLHRSGTSLLTRCLGNHPAISVFRDTGAPADEGQHLQSVYPSAQGFGGPGAFGFAAEAHLTETSPLATDENRRKLVAEWGPYWDLDSPVLVEKSPPNLIRTRFLQALFPDARFVIIIRHPVAVSYATHKWRVARRQSSRRNRLFSKSSIRSLLEHWLVCHETFSCDSEYVRNLHVLRYEDFVRDPAGSLEGVYSFLGLEPARAGLEVRADSNERYFAKWRAREPEVLGRPYKELLSWRYERRVSAWGYSLRDLESTGWRVE